MPILMKYEGIQGESKIAGYEGYLELITFDWGANRAFSVIRGVGVEVGECAVAEVSITRRSDGCSAAVLRECLTGEFDRSVVVSFARTGGISATDLMTWELGSCGIKSYSISHTDSGDYPIESISLAFRRIACLAYPVDDSLRAPPDDTSFDLVTGGR